MNLLNTILNTSFPATIPLGVQKFVFFGVNVAMTTVSLANKGCKRCKAEGYPKRTVISTLDTTVD